MQLRLPPGDRARPRLAGRIPISALAAGGLVAAVALAAAASLAASGPAVAADDEPGWIGLWFENREGPGAEVTVVAAGGPAERAGLAAGDVILKADGAALADAVALAKALRRLRAGGQVKLQVARGETEREVAVVATAFDFRSVAQNMLERGVSYLVSRQQPSGSWPHFQIAGDAVESPPTTALVLKTMAGLPPAMRERHAETIDRAADFLLERTGPDGRVGAGEERYGYVSYTTALALSGLARLRRPQDADAIARIRANLVKRQLDDGEGVTEYEFMFYGAWNYHDEDARETLRGDTSITSTATDALRAAGLPADSPVWARARLFLARAQNFAKPGGPVGEDGEPRTSAQPGPADGGFAFSARESKAGNVPLAAEDGEARASVHFRSYGSATADGLRASIYAGVSKDDPRIAAAVAWLGRNFDPTRNPGFTEDPIGFARGIYFYYLCSLADALGAADVTVLTARNGRPIDWRAHLTNALARQQRPDGSWSNPITVMSEDDPVLATAFAVQVLIRCLQEGAR